MPSTLFPVTLRPSIRDLLATNCAPDFESYCLRLTLEMSSFHHPSYSQLLPHPLPWLRLAMDDSLESIGMSDDNQTNHEKLRDRGQITQEQYEEAMAKLQQK